jgi:predicted AAA+ superfamily ATPase
MFISRLVKPSKLKSFFLFGARGVGKTTFVGQFFVDLKVLKYDLLDPEVEDRFLLHPEDFRDEILAKEGSFDWILVDEVQKCPKLLNVVHKLIVEKKFLFALTGSSARRLKQKGTNLLAGRALSETLYPFTYRELGNQFDLNHALHFGTLPEVISETDIELKIKFLRSYALNYLKYEIQAEQWVKNLDPFRKFLAVCAQCSGKIVNYSNIARDVGTSPATVRSYFEILEDTLVGFHLPAYHRSVRKQQRESPKFYIFDLGVKRAMGRSLESRMTQATSAYGEAFEEFFILEAYRLVQYLKPDYELSYLLTKDGAEIDLIVSRPGQVPLLVEIKSKTRVDERDARHLKHFQRDFENPLLLIASLDEADKKIGDVHALFWTRALDLIVE